MYQMKSSNTLLTSDKGQPLNKGQNQKTMGPNRVRYTEVPAIVHHQFCHENHSRTSDKGHNRNNPE